MILTQWSLFAFRNFRKFSHLLSVTQDLEEIQASSYNNIYWKRFKTSAA